MNAKGKYAKTKISRFTLLEMAVAMSIFAILMLILMQIFGATQAVWRSSSAKADTAASVRAALDLLEDGISSALPLDSNDAGKSCFFYDKSKQNTSDFFLWFPTTLSFQMSGAITKNVEEAYILDNNNLYVSFTKDTATTTEYLLLENVISCNLEIYNSDYSKWNNTQKLPGIVIIELETLLDDEQIKNKYETLKSSSDYTNASDEQKREMRSSLTNVSKRIIYVQASKLND
ncbi:MAG TPA: hypothetical protein DDZ04_09920 [Parabacteroides sp.]|nr:hypothetical protein [Parabacteroides sp.]